MDSATLVVDQIALKRLFELFAISLAMSSDITQYTPLVPVFWANGPFYHFHHCDFHVFYPSKELLRRRRL